MPGSSKTQDKSEGELLFSPDIPACLSAEAAGRPWKLLIVDDEEAVHSVTRLVLEGLNFKGRPLELLHGYSAQEGQTLVERHPDAAVLLLDVVMETEQAGLELVKYVRDTVNNKFLRIILRTGQPGQAPERTVISLYDINDYREKTDLTAQKLVSAVITALRAYDDLKTIEQLATSKESLERMVRERTWQLEQANRDLQTEIGERIRAIAALRESQSRLAEAQRIARIGNFEWDLARHEIHCSDQVFRVLGLPPDADVLAEERFFALIDPRDTPEVHATIERAIATRATYQIEYRITTEEGESRQILHQGEIAGNGVASRIVGTLQDVTERHEAERQMRQLSTAVQQTADGVMITDRNGIVEYVNPAFTAITGYTAEEIVGRTPRLLRSGEQGQAFYKRMWATILQGKTFSDVVINRRKDGTLYYEERTITPQKDARGGVTHFISTGKDITERMEAQEHIRHLAHHDALTGLANRSLLLDRLDQALARMRWRQRKVAIMFLDLDRFKIINDTLGHHAGDELLCAAAQALQGCVREGDTVSRLGGDEFAVILNDIALDEDVRAMARKILHALAQPFTVQGREVFITTSIGISLFPRNGDDAQTLLKKADLAMYHAKSLGKNNFQHYTEEHENRAVERLTMETALRRALEKEEYFLYYQPKLNLRSWQVDSFEALLRWSHSELGMVSPLQFIPLLEDMGLIVEVGEWVLRNACRHEKGRQEAGRLPCRIACNISSHQFRLTDFADKVAQILDETGLDPRFLELELTEGVLIDDIQGASAVLSRLHEIGVGLSIDDFGTGYSSMNYLKRLPFDTLKIDRSFVHDITLDPDAAAIASGILSLAHTMGLKVVAEGVETREQLAFLQSQGCDYLQGYLCSPPVPPEAIEAIVHDDYRIWSSLAPVPVGESSEEAPHV